MPADRADQFWPALSDGELEELGLLLLSDEEWATYITRRGLHDLLDLDGTSLVEEDKEGNLVPKDAAMAASVARYEAKIRENLAARALAAAGAVAKQE